MTCDDTAHATANAILCATSFPRPPARPRAIPLMMWFLFCVFLFGDWSKEGRGALFLFLWEEF